MIEPRIYRAAFIPALLAIVLVAFSLEAPPPPLGQGLAADALFDGQEASGLLSEILQTANDRRPGSAGDRAVASEVQTAFTRAGFPTTVDDFSAGGHRLVNVVARKPGDVTRQIVIVAGRDAAGVPDAASSGADTAALMEFAHVFQGSATHHTIVLASVDGQTLGDAGARELAPTIPRAGPVDAVISISNLGADRSRGPLIVGWSNSSRRGSVGLERTAAESLRDELGQVPHAEGAIAQFARLAFPIAPGAQGVLLKAGLPAIRISGSGELPPAHERFSDIAQARYGELGRGALRLVSTLDGNSRTPVHGPASYVQVSGQLLPGWGVSVLALTLMLPALLASVDAFARTRRRHDAVAPWLGWLAIGAVPFALAYIAGKLFVLVGLGPYAPPSPLLPGLASLGVAGSCLLALTVCVAALAWIVLRPWLIRLAGGLPSTTAAGAASATALLISALGVAIAFMNPYAALVLVPFVHLSLLALLTGMRWSRATLAVVVGAIPLCGIGAYYSLRFQLDPLHGVYYLVLLVLGGQPGVLGTVAICVLLGACASLAAILLARFRERPARLAAPEAAPQPLFGPGGHAGPGALGGTRSTLRR